MAETHVLSALRDKRAELSGLIRDIEKQIGQHRVDCIRPVMAAERVVAVVG